MGNDNKHKMSENRGFKITNCDIKFHTELMANSYPPGNIIALGFHESQNIHVHVGFFNSHLFTEPDSPKQASFG